MKYCFSSSQVRCLQEGETATWNCPCELSPKIQCVLTAQSHTVHSPCSCILLVSICCPVEQLITIHTILLAGLLSSEEDRSHVHHYRSFDDLRFIKLSPLSCNSSSSDILKHRSKSGFVSGLIDSMSNPRVPAVCEEDIIFEYGDPRN